MADEERLLLSAGEVEQIRREAEARRTAPSPPPYHTTGAGLITAERLRQVEAEGWTPEHDDGHAVGRLVDAAICYAMAGQAAARGEDMHDRYGTREDGGVGFPALWRWPWEAAAWKPTGDAIRNLAKAGALIAAEIDRLQRAGEEAGT